MSEKKPLWDSKLRCSGTETLKFIQKINSRQKHSYIQANVKNAQQDSQPYARGDLCNPEKVPGGL
jgi:hypothetical protein